MRVYIISAIMVKVHARRDHLFPWSLHDLTRVLMY